MGAKFNHDCDKCKFVRHENEHDIYECESHLVARYGDWGSEFQAIRKTRIAELEAAGDRRNLVLPFYGAFLEIMGTAVCTQELLS